MSKLSKSQKQIVMVAGGALVLFLLYRWYVGNRNQQATGTATPATDTAASDYAALAGQEQGDVAALQQQEQSDFANLLEQIQGFTSGLEQLATTLTGQQTEINKIAAGEKKINRAQTITTHRGGAFYNYYKKVTGHAPPAHLSASNFIYRAYKAGINAGALRQLRHGGKKTNHAGARNQHVQHPNAGHDQQVGKHRGTGVRQPSGGWGHTKTRQSGRHR